MSATHDIIAVIDSRLRQARREMASLEAARKAIAAPAPAAPRNGRPNQTAAAAGSGRGNQTAAAPRNGRGSRTAGAARNGRGGTVPAGKLQVLLQAAGSDGLSAAALAEQAGGDRQRVLRLLRELEAAGNVRRSGDRRTTRWHLITDEDRIAARVAELERASRAHRRG